MRLYPKASFEFNVTEQYRNMKEVLLLHPQVVDYAKEAIKRAGLKVKMESIRGGTDGSRFHLWVCLVQIYLPVNRLFIPSLNLSVCRI